MTSPETILITGASSGIGAALALEYAAAGVALILTARNAERLAAVAETCIARGATVHTALIDVRDAAALVEFILRMDAMHPIDLIIANAGISAGTFAGEKSFIAAQGVFDVNVNGVLNTIHPIIPRMVKRRAGQVVIISSLAGILPWPGAAAYSASKAAVRYYGEALRGQLKRYGVTVSVVCPGWIHTPLVAVNKFPMPLIMSAARAARIIRRGIAKRKTRIAFPCSLYFMLRCASMLPVSVTTAIGARLPTKPHRS